MHISTLDDRLPYDKICRTEVLKHELRPWLKKSNCSRIALKDMKNIKHSENKESDTNTKLYTISIKGMTLKFKFGI